MALKGLCENRQQLSHGARGRKTDPPHPPKDPGHRMALMCPVLSSEEGPLLGRTSPARADSLTPHILALTARPSPRLISQTCEGNWVTVADCLPYKTRSRYSDGVAPLEGVRMADGVPGLRGPLLCDTCCGSLPHATRPWTLRKWEATAARTGCARSPSPTCECWRPHRTAPTLAPNIFAARDHDRGDTELQFACRAGNRNESECGKAPPQRLPRVREGAAPTPRPTAILAAQRRGEDVETSKKWAAGQNKQHSITKNTAKLDRETEELHHDRVTLEVGKVIQQGRQSKGLTQKDLATKINEKPQVIADYESGRAIPNNQVLGKIERAIGECPLVLYGVSAAAP
ncbi:endothelial differentiation-related factor 1 [Ailuropoda melanoleuca]|uniref:endothelial differentiation-related factor 1 n=1 Tax=Ailuropoda melanoleuca TaxID=9646 RepID=UPI001494400A|nr:endothelial differentiation-related factor 1 [Ailuropoda melanoleuca]